MEIIAVDGGSTDGSQEIRCPSIDSIRRAIQMNVGAKAATGNILYFLHCDSLPLGILTALSMILFKTGIKGCFRMKFDYRHPVLMISQWFTRFNHISCRDQSLFITNYLKNSKDLMRISSFMRTMKLFLGFIKKQFVVIPDYNYFGQKIPPKIWRLQYHFSIIHLKRRLGHSTESMLHYYKRTSFKQVLL
jgi:glycosyltransferase involved in cell wall biosynthesis